MSLREMSMDTIDTIMEDSASFVSNTDAILYCSSDISGHTESLISDPNIPNSSSTSEDEYQQISTAGGGGTDDLSVSSCASSSWFTNNNNNNIKQSDSDEIRFELSLGLNVCGDAVQHHPADAVVRDLREFVVQQSGAMKEVWTYFAEDLDQRIQVMNAQYIVQCIYYPENLMRLSFYETCLDFKSAYFVANEAIIRAFSDSNRVHIIDFSFNQVPLQWRALMQGLAFRPGGPPAFRLTGIGLSKPDNTVESKLAQFAEEIGLEFEFRSIVVNPLADDIDATILNIRPSNVEAMAVHNVFEIHHLLSRPGPIEKLLNLVREMQPKIVTVIEQEANHNRRVLNSIKHTV